MQILTLYIPKSFKENGQIGIKETYKVGKRKGGTNYRIVVGLTANMQPLNVSIKKQGLLKVASKEELQQQKMPSFYYILSEVGYLLDISYTLYDDGTEKFRYKLLIPKGVDKEKKILKCKEVVLAINLKANLIQYYKQLCLSRANIKCRPRKLK